MRRSNRMSWPARAIGLAILAVSSVTIARVRPVLFQKERSVKAANDVYALPPPSALAAFSLGYRSALADLFFTSTIIRYGIAGEERRRFDAVGDYLDAIIALDPKLRDTYRYADTMIIFQAKGEPTPDHIRHARRILDRGVKELPGDAYLWTSYGQFLAFLGTQWLTDDAEKEEFRAAGARALAHAGELGSSNTSLGWHALSGLGVFTKQGQREAAISALERMYAVTDDASLREQIALRLQNLRREGDQERAQSFVDAFEETWRKDLPFVSRTTELVIGPAWDTAACAGRPGVLQADGSAPEAGCTPSWALWAAARNR